MKTLNIDIESYSSVDLTKSGVYKYSESSDFEIILFGYSVDGGQVQVIDLANAETIPHDILEALTDDAVDKWAFNANFERVCLSRHLLDMGINLAPFADNHFSSESQGNAKYLNPKSWRCSMVWSAHLGLPLSLENVGLVLGLEKQKLTVGKDLIRYFCKPCAATAANGRRTRNTPSHYPEKWELFKSYNRRDVETEMAMQARLAKFPVPDNIWEEYHQDQEINDRGVLLDMTLARAFGIAEEEAFCVGTGTAQPTGIFTASGGNVGITAGSATAITVDNIIDLIYALKSPYRRNAVFLMKDATVSTLRKLKDNNGAYLWQPSVQAGQPDRLLGYPIYTSPYVPAVAASALPIAFGDFSNYWIADRMGRTVQRLNELYAGNGQVGFIATERVDGKVILSEGIQLLRMGA